MKKHNFDKRWGRKFLDDLGKTKDKEKAAPDATNIQSGKVESESPNPHSISDFIKRLEEMQA